MTKDLELNEFSRHKLELPSSDDIIAEVSDSHDVARFPPIRALVNELSKCWTEPREPFRTHSHRSSSSAALIISKKEGGLLHKYVMGRIDEHYQYAIALPIDWVYAHKQIVRALDQLSGRKVSCSGGGFLLLAPEPIVYGLSCEYGPGQEVEALSAFRSALARSNQDLQLFKYRS